MIFGRKIPTQRVPHSTIPDHRVSINRAARRQAFRYGEQLRQCAVGSPEHLAVGTAWAEFIKQFDEDPTVFAFIKGEFIKGVESAPGRAEDLLLV